MGKLLFSACLIAVNTSPALAEPINFPTDHTYETVRGLVVDDDKKGVIIIQGNQFYEKGQHFTHVNKQEVKTAREFSLLVAAAVVSGTLSLTSKSDAVAEKSDRPPIPPKEWARALAFSDSPNGVVIEYSLRPEQIGGIFEKFNGEPVSTAADLKAKLERFIASPLGDWSTTINQIGTVPPIEQIKADAITQALPPITYSQTTASARPLFLYRAVENEPLRPSPADTKLFAETWGPLAKLAGKIFIGDIFDETCEKASSGNSCYSMIWWQQPGKILARAWYADRGFLVAADTILPTGRPGLFMVHRWRPEGGKAPTSGEVGNHFLRVTKATLAEKGTKFQFVDSPVTSAMPSDEPRVSSLTQIDPVRYRSMSSYSRSRALADSKSLRDSIQRSINATREAERQRQRDASMSAVYGALNSVGQAMEQQRLDQQVQFEQQMRDRQRSQASSSYSSGSSSSGGAIIMSRPEEPAYSPPPPPPPQPSVPVQTQPDNSQKLDCWGRPVSGSSSSSSGSSSGGGVPVCPQ